MIRTDGRPTIATPVRRKTGTPKPPKPKCDPADVLARIFQKKDALERIS